MQINFFATTNTLIDFTIRRSNLSIRNAHVGESNHTRATSKYGLCGYAKLPHYNLSQLIGTAVGRDMPLECTIELPLDAAGQ